MSNKKLVSIIKSIPYDVTVDFCGSQISFPVGKCVHTKLLVKYNNLISDAVRNYNININKLKNKEADISNVLDCFLTYAMPIIEEISQDANSINVHSINKQYIVSYCENNGFFDELYKYKDDTMAHIEKLVEKYSAGVEERELRKELRPKVTSMTISNKFSDFTRNHADPDTANADDGIAYDFVNSVSNHLAKSKLEKEVDEYLCSRLSAAKQAAKNCYGNFLFAVKNVLVALLKDFVGITSTDISQAETIFKNLKASELPINVQYFMAQQIIMLAPYKEEYYSYFFEKFPDYRKDIYNTADFFGIDLYKQLLTETTAYIESNLKYDELNSVIVWENYVNSLITDYKLSALKADAFKKIVIRAKQRILNNEAKLKFFEFNGDYTETDAFIETRASELGEGINREDSRKCIRNLCAQAFLYHYTGQTIESAVDCCISFRKHASEFDISQEEIAEYISKIEARIVERIKKYIENTDYTSVKKAKEVKKKIDSVMVSADLSSQSVNELNTAFEQKMISYRTIEGQIIENINNTDKIRSILKKSPQLYDDNYSFDDTAEIESAIALTEKAIEPLDHSLAVFLKNKLNLKLADKLVDNPPSMYTHAEYEDYILKLQKFSDSEKAFDAAYLTEIKLIDFEANCRKAKRHNIWHYILDFIGYIISSFVLGNIIIGLFNVSFKEMFNNPLLYFLLPLAVFILCCFKNDTLFDAILFTILCDIPITLFIFGFKAILNKPPILYILLLISAFISFSKLKNKFDLNKDAWERITIYGKNRVKDAERVKYPNRKKVNSPRFERGESFFSEIVQITSLPKDVNTLILYKSPKETEDKTEIELRKYEYAGIINSDDKDFHYVKYYSWRGIHYGYLQKEFTTVSKVTPKFVTAQ